ncbi:MAG: beta strand repeat-containing protein, partial [Pseudohongiellaceae bacterium]
PTSATITVRDTDSATVSIGAGTTVRESGSATFTISTGGIEQGQPLVVQLAVDETAGSYLDGTPPNRITVAAGDNSVILSVALDDDGVVETAGRITARIVLSGGTTTSDGYTLAAGASTAVVTVLDNDVAITADAARVVEDASGLRFAIARGNLRPTETFGITVSQTGNFIDMVGSGGNAVPVAADGSVEYQVVLGNGIAVVRLPITLVDDNDAEANGRITATVTTVPAVYALGVGTSSASAIVVDDDSPTPILTLADASAQEGQQLEFVVSLSPPSLQPVSFEYDTAEGNATENDDYFPFRSVRRATIPAGQSTLTLRVQTNTDNLDEPNEFMRLLILKASVVNAIFGPGSGINDNFATGTIIDINAPVLLIAAGTTSAITEGAPAPFVVSLSTNSVRVGVALDFEVRVNNSGNDDNRRSNYITPDPLTLTGRLEPGATRVTVNAPTDDDDQDEVNGSISAFLPMPTDGSYAVIRSNFARISVNDNDATGVTIAGGAAVGEGFDAEFFITPVTTPTAELSVVVQVDNGTGDFLPGTPPLTRTVTVPAGTTTDVSFSVPTDDDLADEPDGSIIASIQSDSSYSRNRPFTATVAVSDNDEISLTLGAASAMESGNLVFALQLSDARGPDLLTSPQPITLQASTADGSAGARGGIATAPADYTALTDQSITIAAGESVATITVTLIDDSDDEPNETLTLTVTGTINGEAVSASARGTIEDDDDAVISISAANSSITEADTAVFIVSNGGIAQEAALPVSISIDNGTGDDFLPGTPPLTLSVTIARGSNTATLNVALDDDSTDEPNGSITATVTAGTGYTPATGGAETTTITVADNDVPTVTIAANTSSVTEGDTVTFTVTAGAEQSDDVNVPAVVFGGSFLRNQPSIVTFTITTGNSTASRDIVTDDDRLEEPNGEIALRLLRPGVPAAYQLGDPSQATVSVSDNEEPPMPGLSLRNASATEGNAGDSNTLDFTLNLSRQASVAITVYVSTRDGNSAINDSTITATAPADYTALTMQQVVFNIGDSMATVSVPLVGDTTDERNEQFTLVVSDDAAGTTTLLEALGTILDDDDTSVSITTSTPTINEGQDALFILTATAPQDADLTVNVSVTETGGEHALGLGDREIVIGQGRNTASFRVQTEDDRFVDATGTIQAALQTGNGYTPDAANDSVDVTVNDNEAATPAVTIVAVSAGAVTEGAPVVFAITSSTSMSSALAVNLLLSQQGDFIDGSAAGLTAVGDNFTTQATIAASNSTATLTVATVMDMNFEADGAIIASVQTDAAYRIASPSVASVIVADDGTELPEVSISDDNEMMTQNFTAEEGTPFFFRVTLSAATGRVTTLFYETSDGTADSNEYGGPPAPSRIHFGPADTVRTIRIGQRNDQIDEPNETFTLRLFSTVMPQEVEFADGTAEATVTATILDNDVNISISADNTSVEEGDPVVFTLTADTTAGTAHSSADIPVLVYLLESRRNNRAIGILDAAASNPALTAVDPTNPATLIGSEYTLEINLPAGETTVMFTIALSENMLQEMDTSFSATVQRVLDGRNYLPAAAPNNSVEVQVANDDLPVVSISAGNTNTTILEGNDMVYVFEVSPVQSTALTVNVLLTRDTGVPAFPALARTNPESILGISPDAGATYNGMVPIPAGQASVVVTIETGTNTSIINQNASAAVSISMNAAYAIDAAASTVTFTAEDAPQLVGTDPAAVSEGAGTIEFELALDRVPTLPVSVNYATRGRTLPLNPSDPPLAISEQDFVATA